MPAFEGKAAYPTVTLLQLIWVVAVSKLGYNVLYSVHLFIGVCALCLSVHPMHRFPFRDFRVDQAE